MTIKPTPLPQYAGNWYELKRYDTTLQENGDCSTFDYAYDFANANPTELSVTARWSYNDNRDLYHYGTAVMAGAANEGRMSVTWTHRADAPVNYNIIATDYDHYSIIWDCQNLDNGRSNEDAWVLSKDQRLDESVQAEVQRYLAQYLEEGRMRDTYQGATCLNIEG